MTEKSTYCDTVDNSHKIDHYIKDAISELDFKKYTEAKKNIQNALQYINK